MILDLTPTFRLSDPDFPDFPTFPTFRLSDFPDFRFPISRFRPDPDFPISCFKIL